MLLILAIVPLATPAVGVAQAASATTKDSSGPDLAQQAADPTAPLMAFNFKAEYKPSYYGLPGSGNDFLFQPVIPFAAWHKPNLLRATISYNISGPFPTDLDSDDTSNRNRGLDSASVFDLLVFNKQWGRWGFGPLVNFAPNEGKGSDTTTAGPAIGFVARQGKWNLGLFNQNLFGHSTRFSSIQPVISYSLGHGWTAASGDAQFAIDWTSPQFVNVPIGVQIAKVTKLGKQPVRFLVNPEYNARSVTGTPHWTIRFGFTILAPSK